jgi:hypothetical protein
MAKKKDTNKIGIAGEFLVASKLSEMGFVVGATRKNTADIDILVSDDKKAKLIQVKATEGPPNEWMCPVDMPVSDDLYYVLVNLNTKGPRNSKGTAVPSFHIVSSKTVKASLDKQKREGEADYKARHGKPYAGPDRYKFFDAENTYKDKWDALGLVPQE